MDPKVIRADEVSIPVLTDPKTGVTFPVDLPTGPRQERIAKRYMDRLSPEERCRVQFAVQTRRLQAPRVPTVYQRLQLWQDISAAVMRGAVE